ncbi:hypothetical protein GWK90_03485 [Candidatus Hamiltonella defensa]|uniref:Rha family transcriptional regulator n=1 Tax=Candidatus Williamhamiltonella defendens TaxID=138072 RepID=UPI000D6017CB|nr:Rha family transcriptional regulator [Candidatus Hamiltonella defensa]AWK17361.1 hypothetical protein CCS40_07095 [Candidatus Hamiltonella defensa]MBK4361356.1 hypothetical protein [Candidatus Hamiltonella defensa]
MPLVEIKKFDLVSNSSAIALGVKKEHKPVIQLVRKYQSDLEEFARVEFEMRPFQTKGGAQKKEVALLNEQQTTLLITYMRNNPIVRAFKKRLVAEFFRMRAALENKEKSRNVARLEYKPMMEAIEQAHRAQGQSLAPHHFRSEADLINHIAVGMTAAQFRVYHNISHKESLRDYLTPEQIYCITELQRANTVFLRMGWDFKYRQTRLMQIFEQYHCPSLIKEQRRLLA